MAERVGVDRSFLAGVERGKRNVSILNVSIIAKGLGVSLSQLFCEDVETRLIHDMGSMNTEGQ